MQGGKFSPIRYLSTLCQATRKKGPESKCWDHLPFSIASRNVPFLSLRGLGEVGGRERALSREKGGQIAKVCAMGEGEVQGVVWGLGTARINTASGSTLLSHILRSTLESSRNRQALVPVL